MTRKNLLLFSLIIVLLYIGFDLASLFQKENLTAISFSDFRRSIGVALSGTGIFLGYIKEIKKQKISNIEKNPEL